MDTSTRPTEHTTRTPSRLAASARVGLASLPARLSAIRPVSPVPGRQASTPVAPARTSSGALWGSLAHLGGILLFVPSLVLWLVFRRRPGFAAYEAKEALNWQVTLAIGLAPLTVLALVTWVLALVAPLDTSAAITGVPWALYGLNLVLSVLGYLRARNGVGYRYPFALRFLR